MISLTLGSEYQYKYENDNTCIEVKTDVMFTLTNGTDTVKFDGTNFTVKSGDCAWANETAASLTLDTGNDNLLSLKFKYDAKNQSTMDAMFTFNPYEYFPGGSIPLTTSIIDNGDLLLGENKKLFRCNSPQRITLTGTLEKTKYTMYMDMSNTQIQAFGIKDGNLSTDG